jgi:hypothetical protein
MTWDRLAETCGRWHGGIQGHSCAGPFDGRNVTLTHPPLVARAALRLVRSPLTCN